MSWLDALLGRVQSNSSELELQGAINFRQGLRATADTVNKVIHVDATTTGVDIPDETPQGYVLTVEFEGSTGPNDPKVVGYADPDEFLGATGPTGATGPMGPTGATGPAGERIEPYTIADATHDIAVEDENRLGLCTNVAGCTVALLADADAALPVGATVLFAATVTGQQVAFAAGAGAALQVPPSASAVSRDQYSLAAATKTAVNTWLVWGDLEPV